MNHSTNAPIVFLALPEVKRRTGMGTTYIYTEMNAGRFPKAVRVGKRATRWIEAEVDHWCQQRIDASRPMEPEEQAA
ncbi:AlpA family phage regulatory protein [Pseudomonas nitroreducens]|uniref:AlpA family phage regulatory protein n=1 Tax=Pseudomonas nitroreducens TaxID=46680 RepID=A0A6G6IPA3_PSENT|nr:AlpA family phage regulatory protein [Pseudomonas nitroreducens]QIE84938.1 AlpA family phage regulatory protein [Pseudomonas nitroreducens]